jgi:hypothetical protein
MKYALETHTALQSLFYNKSSFMNLQMSKCLGMSKKKNELECQVVDY